MSLVKMNIVMSYPISWSVYSIISNYVQNFYDALGMENFASGFHYEVIGMDTLYMESASGFDKEWLYYIGTSTKRDSSLRTAGGFGEGFKFASLAAYRDYNVDITMESRDWSLHVTTVKGDIAGKECEFLAYDVGSRPYVDNACLTLKHINDEFVEKMKYIMSDYYYPENERFGKCLAECVDFAIYEATLDKYDIEKHRKRPSGGYIFASYQRRAFINVPIVICNHTYYPSSDDRDREDFSTRESNECTSEVIDCLGSRQAYDILIYLQFIWGRGGRDGFGDPDWKRVIRELISKVSYDDELVEKFQKNFRDRLIIRDTSYLTYSRNRRSMAMAWFQSSSFRGSMSFVLPSFHRLGIRTLSELCEENDGFTAEREPNEKESSYIQILRKAATDILSDVLVLDEINWPECCILLNPKAPVSGYTRIVNTKGGTNKYGLTVRKAADHVYIQSWVIQNAGFSHAFATYSHELLHQFGGDSTMQFHRALGLMNEKIMENTDKIKKYEEEWYRIR